MSRVQRVGGMLERHLGNELVSGCSPGGCIQRLGVLVVNYLPEALQLEKKKTMWKNKGYSEISRYVWFFVSLVDLRFIMLRIEPRAS